MEMIIGQVRYFLASFGYGIILMLCYDFIDVFRHLIRHGKIARWLGDWLFWLIASIVVFQMVFTMNYGMIRFFFVGGLVLGMWLYRRIVGKHIVHGICSLFTTFSRTHIWLLGKFDKKMAKIKKSS